MGIQEEFILKLAAEGTRLDKRALDAFREVQVEINPIPKAEGSARVRLGRTDVLVGVKMEVGEPFADKPDEGTLMVNAELSPMASPHFEPGPPREASIELARVVDRGIRESHAIDVKKLCMTPKEKSWTVMIDLQVMNYDGNLIDACSLAALAALKHARFPAYDGETVDYTAKTDKKLPLSHEPLAVTVYKLGGAKPILLVDPTAEEEEIAVARLTVSTNEAGNIAALQKGGAEGFTLEEIAQAFQLSLKQGAELRTHLKG